MSKVVDGYKNQVWLIVEYDGMKEISEERIPQSGMSESQLVQKLMNLSGVSPRKESSHGKRVSYVAGDDHHWIASLWRADEMEERDRRDRSGER